MSYLGIIPDLNFTIFGGAKHLLAFNEPNFYSQSNLTPMQAAKLWPTIEAIAKEVFHSFSLFISYLFFCCLVSRSSFAVTC